MPALGAGARESVRVRIPPPAQEFAQLSGCICGFISAPMDTKWTHFSGEILGVQARSNHVEVGVEQVGVDPQRHRRIFVPRASAPGLAR